MNINEFIKQYDKLKFWFVSYKNYCFKLKSVNTECDEIYIIVGGFVGRKDMEIQFNKEYHLSDFSIQCAMIKKSNGERMLVDNIINAKDYF